VSRRQLTRLTLTDQGYLKRSRRYVGDRRHGVIVMKLKLALAAGGLALAMAAPAWATITICSTPPCPGNPAENVLLTDPSSGTTVLGTTNQTGTIVTFTGNETLTEPANGQARIVAVDGTFNLLTIGLQNPTLGMTAIEFNLDAATDGPATLTFFDQFGTPFAGVFTLDNNGQNFFTATASAGELIKTVQISSQVQLTDIQQVRLGTSPIGVIPEPTTWGMMILGFFGLGTMLRRRRRAKASLGLA
jgi:hypothetical protein